MNYFEFYELPVSFDLDAERLRKIFYANSRKYHPDFYTQDSAEAQAEALERSTLNNEAYKTLSNADLRMRYVLQLYAALPEEGQSKLPQDFLMDMMDINEALMDLQMDFDGAAYKRLISQIEQIELGLFEEVRPLMARFSPDEHDAQYLSPIKDYYLKRRYLLRIRENLDKFVPLS